MKDLIKEIQAFQPRISLFVKEIEECRKVYSTFGFRLINPSPASVRAESITEILYVSALGMNVVTVDLWALRRNLYSRND